jgi:hypothetical protein
VRWLQLPKEPQAADYARFDGAVAGAAALIRSPAALEVLQDEAGTLLMQLLNLQDSSKTDGEEAEARFGPGPPGRLSVLSFFLCKPVLCGAFVWARRAFDSRKRRLPAPAAAERQRALVSLVVVVPAVGLALAQATSAANYSLATRLRCMRILEDAAAELSGRAGPPPSEEAPALPAAPAAPAAPTDVVAVSTAGLEQLCGSHSPGISTRLGQACS